MIKFIFIARKTITLEKSLSSQIKPDALVWKVSISQIYSSLQGNNSWKSWRNSHTIIRSFAKRRMKFCSRMIIPILMQDAIPAIWMITLQKIALNCISQCRMFDNISLFKQRVTLFKYALIMHEKIIAVIYQKRSCGLSCMGTYWKCSKMLGWLKSQIRKLLHESFKRRMEYCKFSKL